MTETQTPSGASAPAFRGSQPAMLYQTQYVWFVFLSTLDLLFTWTILHAGGRELNFIADAVIQHGGKLGLIGYKMGWVVLIILMIETIGRKKPHVGKRVAEWAVAITSIPVAIGGILLIAKAIVG